MSSTSEAWRALWTVSDDSGLGLPNAVHSNGLAVTFVYTELEEDGPWGWCPMIPTTHQACAAELRVRLGDGNVERLIDEASTLWRELGHVDESP